jgi:hypothetical protein
MLVGVKFHSSKLSPEQVKLFRRIEHERVDKQLDGYVRQCSKMKVLFYIYLLQMVLASSYQFNS